jgi:hypothetical protein
MRNPPWLRLRRKDLGWVQAMFVVAKVAAGSFKLGT